MCFASIRDDFSSFILVSTCSLLLRCLLASVLLTRYFILAKIRWKKKCCRNVVCLLSIIVVEDEVGNCDGRGSQNSFSLLRIDAREQMRRKKKTKHITAPSTSWAMNYSVYQHKFQYSFKLFGIFHHLLLTVVVYAWKRKCKARKQDARQYSRLGIHSLCKSNKEECCKKLWLPIWNAEASRSEMKISPKKKLDKTDNNNSNERKKRKEK